jgi:hypothetical protein
MRICTLCFIMIYQFIVGFSSVTQVSNRYKQNEDLVFTNFEIVHKNGRLDFKWDVTNQLKCRYFEVERGDSKNNFKVIALAFPFENNQDSTYKYYEYINQYPMATSAFYRIKARMENDRIIYSNVVSPANSIVQ